MTNQVLALNVAALIFLVVGILHLLRVVLKIKVVIGTFVVPLWLSVIAVPISALLAFWMYSAVK